MIDIHRFIATTSKVKISTLCATFLLLVVVGEDANQKLEDKVDDLHPTENGEPWTGIF